jgi:glycosyltransferase 2 family protein
MKAASIIAALAGVAVMTALVLVFGAGAVARSLLAVGWDGFAAVCSIQLVLITTMGVAWRGLVVRAPVGAFVWARLVRDAGSEVLPLSPIGGCILGARAVAQAGVPVPIAAASTIVDLTLEFLAKLAYTALGLVCLVRLWPGSPFALPLTAGLAVACLAAAMFILIQRRGSGAVDRLAGFIGRGWAERTAAGAAALRVALDDIHRHRARLQVGFALHLACWITLATQAWLALRLAHRALPFGQVLVIESLLYAVRTMAFAIPNAVGVQEGAYVLIGTAFGLTPEMALALSLLKRARDLTIGLPVLGIWQIAEGGRLWRRRRRKRPAKSI